VSAQYLFRLDDACPQSDQVLWRRLETLFDQYGIKPLVAIIPDCQDPDFAKYPVDGQFWDRARIWQAKGWAIGLHGFEHRFRTKHRGLVPFNAYSEFAGLPLADQQTMIAQGYRLLRQQGLEPGFFVAPAHSFDRDTLRALESQTPIRRLSDGLATMPFKRFGFDWTPQQLWRPRQLKNGLWTICLHPNEMTDHDFMAIAQFLEREAVNFGDWAVMAAPQRTFNLGDWLFGTAFLVARRFKRWLKRADRA
jgi:hypothetical protein